MYAVIFEVEMKPGRAEEYFHLAANLLPQLDEIDGFISVERFQSVWNENKYVSVSFWRDEEAITAWRNDVGHQLAQERGRKEIFDDFRIRVARVVRDYSLADRPG